jgi:hypothetical protein
VRKILLLLVLQLFCSLAPNLAWADPPTYEAKPVDPDDINYRRPQSATQVKYIELIERNTHLLYPALAVLVVVLISFGIISSLRSDDITGIKKAEMKREIIKELRREVYGMTVELLSKNTGIDRNRMIQVLEEMATERLVESRTDTSRVTTWRMRGLTN